MTDLHVEAGRAVFARIGAACDRLTMLGFANVHEAVALGTHERRGQIKKQPERFGDSTLTADRIGRHLTDLAEELELLATTVERASWR